MHYAGTPDLLVLGIPRGGIPVAFEVSEALHAPLDIFVVRKLGVPGDSELAMGAIASGGMRVLNEDIVRGLKISISEINRVARQEAEELKRRELLYRGPYPKQLVRGKTTILVDDGIATGASIRAAIEALRSFKPARLVIAVPTTSVSAYQELRPLVHEFVTLAKPEPFHAVAQSYGEFPQVNDEEVIHLLEQSHRHDLELERTIEPLWNRLNPETLDLKGIDWVILGGESGSGNLTTPFEIEWVEELREHCRSQGIAFFLKQLGRVPMRDGKPLKLIDKHGGNWEEWDEKLRVREFPKAFHDYRRNELVLSDEPRPSSRKKNAEEASLSAVEIKDFKRLDLAVQKGLAAFIECGIALKETLCF